MKKFENVIILSLAMLIPAIVQAKDHHIVIRGSGDLQEEKTEVFTGNGGSSDTLTVVPGRNVEVIDITLKTASGNVLEHYRVPATFEDRLFIISPSLPEGYLLEVRDDKGTLYTKFED